MRHCRDLLGGDAFDLRFSWQEPGAAEPCDLRAAARSASMGELMNVHAASAWHGLRVVQLL